MKMKNKKSQRIKTLYKENFTKLRRMKIRNQLSQQQKIIQLFTDLCYKTSTFIVKTVKNTRVILFQKN